MVPQRAAQTGSNTRLPLGSQLHTCRFHNYVEKVCFGADRLRLPGVGGAERPPSSLRAANLYCASIRQRVAVLGPPAHLVMNYAAHSGSFCMNHCFWAPTWQRTGSAGAGEAV